MKTVLITGAQGFVGRHLWTALEGAGLEPISFDGEIGERSAIGEKVAASKPDGVVHLAALSSVAASWGAGYDVWQTNATGTLNLVSALQEHAPDARLIAVSSAEVYGIVPEREQPIGERRAPSPRSPYAISKLAGEIPVLHSGLDAVVARPFPHLGPGQDERFAIASFAAQIARIESASDDAVLRVGNLEARRDFTDVRCVCEAYVALLQAPITGIVNIASGTALRIGDVLERLLALAAVPIETAVDESRLRPADVPLLCGDAARLREATGWTPRRSLEETLTDTLAVSRRKGPS